MRKFALIEQCIHDQLKHDVAEIDKLKAEIALLKNDLAVIQATKQQENGLSKIASALENISDRVSNN